MKSSAGMGTTESSLELKYCERCGGLWLRPVGGEQIYCTVCARAIAELPPPSTEVKRKATHRKEWEVDNEFEGYTIGEIDFDEGEGLI
jgi:Zn-finger nucleic acid-binding protein